MSSLNQWKLFSSLPHQASRSFGLLLSWNISILNDLLPWLNCCLRRPSLCLCPGITHRLLFGSLRGLVLIRLRIGHGFLFSKPGRSIPSLSSNLSLASCSLSCTEALSGPPKTSRIATPYVQDQRARSSWLFPWLPSPSLSSLRDGWFWRSKDDQPSRNACLWPDRNDTNWTDLMHLWCKFGVRRWSWWPIDL